MIFFFFALRHFFALESWYFYKVPTSSQSSAIETSPSLKPQEILAFHSAGNIPSILINNKQVLFSWSLFLLLFLLLLSVGCLFVRLSPCQEKEGLRTRETKGIRLPMSCTSPQFIANFTKVFFWALPCGEAWLPPYIRKTWEHFKNKKTKQNHKFC